MYLSVKELFVKCYLPIKTVNILAQALVVPHFDYCSSVWPNFSVCHGDELQILQNMLARVLLTADIRNPVDTLMKDLDWTRLNLRGELHLLLQTFQCFNSVCVIFYKTKHSYTYPKS